ncbi:hypothetical protein APHAL10511_003566 [Amanita phalloides]|nr:hypothetical protein APHAL10511_003566 [Amanita phalloides]
MAKPLRPFWITPSTSTFPSFKEKSDNQPFLPIICVSASRQTVEGIERRAGGYTYIQGSGDDHELWGMGLDPKKFWENKDALLASDRGALADLVKQIVSASSPPQRTLGLSSTNNGLGSLESDATPELIPLIPITRVNGMVSIASTPQVGQLARFLQSQRSESSESIYVIATSASLDLDNVRKGTTTPIWIETPDEDRELNPNWLLLTIPDGKKGQLRLLQDALPRAMSFIRFHLLNKRVTRDPLPRIGFICDSNSGLDRSVGLALAALQIFFDDSGNLRKASDWCSTTSDTDHVMACKKTSIQARLEWIISSEPRANPSRTTLKRVNEFLMSPKTFRNANSTALK